MNRLKMAHFKESQLLNSSQLCGKHLATVSPNPRPHHFHRQTLRTTWWWQQVRCAQTVWAEDNSMLLQLIAWQLCTGLGMLSKPSDKHNPEHASKSQTTSWWTKQCRNKETRMYNNHVTFTNCNGALMNRTIHSKISKQSSLQDASTSNKSIATGKAVQKLKQNIAVAWLGEAPHCTAVNNSFRAGEKYPILHQFVSICISKHNSPPSQLQRTPHVQPMSITANVSANRESTQGKIQRQCHSGKTTTFFYTSLCGWEQLQIKGTHVQRRATSGASPAVVRVTGRGGATELAVQSEIIEISWGKQKTVVVRAGQTMIGMVR